MKKRIGIYSRVHEFKKRHPITLAFRTKQHAKIIEKYIDSGETVRYVFAGQKNNTSFEIPNTFIIVITSKRILLGRKRLLFGHFFYSITPDLFNDIKIKANIIWGRIIIDTVKELIVISNISKSALDEIETSFSKALDVWRK